MDVFQRRVWTRYGKLLDDIVEGTVALDDPKALISAHVRFTDGFAPVAKSLLAAYAVDSIDSVTTVSQTCALLAQLCSADSPTTTFAPLPMVRMCRERRVVLADAGEDWATNPYRVLRPDGALILDVPDGWQPNSAVFDLMCAYHTKWYLQTGIDDAEALTRFVERYVEVLAPVVLWDYVQDMMTEYLEAGDGPLNRVLDGIELRNFGRRIHARDGFANYLAEDTDQRRTNLVARGFVDP